MDSSAQVDYAGLDRLMDRVAAALQRDGLHPGDTVALCARSSVRYVAVFLGALRAGAAVVPLPPSVTPATFRTMMADAEARWLFLDDVAEPLAREVPASHRIDLATASAGQGPSGAASPAPGLPFDVWAGEGRGAGGLAAEPLPVTIEAHWPFNIIYSSGTTGTPKGIVQPHAMRWVQVNRLNFRYSPQSVSLIATPLYSNTTLVVLLPTLAHGGSVVLMDKFDPAGYLRLAVRHRATHTMLVPVQYQRLMALPDLESHDLSSFVVKFCTSAPFPAALKADVLGRWPGGLVEFYGMTEGGGACVLLAHEHPDKLHTVGQPADGHDIRLIDEDGNEVAAGQPGEVVGRSSSMMSGYHRQPEATRAAEWFDATGKRFIRTGDVGRFDSEGFLVLLDRRKDLIISGGFNIYPSDLEAVLRAHPQVLEAAVVGAASARWGETPVGFVVLHAAASGSGRTREGDRVEEDPLEAAESILHWANQRLGRTQRLAMLRIVPDLPRSAIGKVLKRELRDSLGAAQIL